MIGRDEIERELRLLRTRSRPDEFAAAVRNLAAVHSQGKEPMRRMLESLLAQDGKAFAAALAGLNVPKRKPGPPPADDPAWLLACLKHSGQRQSEFLPSYAAARSDGPNDDPYARMEKSLTSAKRSYRSDSEFRAAVDTFVELLTEITGKFPKNLP